MEGNFRARKSHELVITVEDCRNPGDDFINISREEDGLRVSKSDKKLEFAPGSPNIVSLESPVGAVKWENVNPPSPANKPPVSVTKRKSLSRCVFSKPKSRFGEPKVLTEKYAHEENKVIVQDVLSNNRSPDVRQNINMDDDVLITTGTPQRLSHRALDEHEEIYNKVKSKKKLKDRKLKAKVLMEWLFFLGMLFFLVASLTDDNLQKLRICGLLIWKWSLLVLVTFGGLLFTRWLMTLVVLLIELNFLLRKRVLYFAYGLKQSAQVFVWISLVLVTWLQLFWEGMSYSKATSRILNFITWSIASLLIGSFLWLIKTLLLKILASTFHVNTFFERIQEAIFHQYILLTLSGPPVMESEQLLGRTVSNTSQVNVPVKNKGKEESKEKRTIDISKLHRMKQEKVSAWTMKMLIDLISNSGLTTISTSIEESFYDGENEKTDKEIPTEDEAIAAAYGIFRNVAQPGSTYIGEFDFRRFMIKEEVDLVFPMIDATESGKIDRKCLVDWLLKVYQDRKALVHALNDTKTAVKQLNRLISGVLVVVCIILWLLLTGIATTRILLFLLSQLVLVGFMFGNTCRTIFEAIIFVFVMHPFDVGDRCVIDGVIMVVEEMNILTTVFLRFDNEKIYYPNSVLATKPISNFYRSPEMGDALEFSIGFTTPMEKIGSLKEKIKNYLESNSQLWHPSHMLVVKEIKNVNEIKMVLYFNHTMNFQDIGEKNRRRTELVLALKTILEELLIGYNLLPQEVHLRDR